MHTSKSNYDWIYVTIAAFFLGVGFGDDLRSSFLISMGLVCAWKAWQYRGD